MLVLSRGLEDKVVFPNLGITVEILRINGNRVRIGVDAPEDVRILRHELADTYSEQLSAGAASARSGSESHRLRNQLNVAHVALGLAEKQLNAGLQDKALETLRRAVKQFDVLDSSMDQPARPDRSSNKDRPRTLLVEDDENESELLAGYLRMSGFEVDTATDGLQAMLYLGRHDCPDLVLLDMNMPRMDGMSAIRSIRGNADLQTMRVFAVTGVAAEESQVELGPNGVDRWFRKPIKPQVLVDSMREILGLVVA
ncbi:MAG: response regulator [Planctomycetales bacterium]|nr:response regulator [Planctomycetales bacterium]